MDDGRDNSGGGGGLTAGADGGGTPPPPCVALYLEHSQDNVTPAPDPIGSIIVLPHRCKTSFCPECSPGIGRRVRRRLLGVVGFWLSPKMLIAMAVSTKRATRSGRVRFSVVYQ